MPQKKALPVYDENGNVVKNPSAPLPSYDENGNVVPQQTGGAGGSWTPAPPPPTLGQQIATGAENIGEGIGKGLLQTGTALSPYLNKIPGIGKYLAPQEGITAAQNIAQPTNTAQKIGKYGEQAAEFFVPGLGEEDAEAQAAKYLPWLGKYAPMAGRTVLNTLGTGAVNKLQGGSFLQGAGAGLVGSGIGEGLRSVGGKIAQRAAGVTEKQLKYGANPGQEILDLKGIRPSTVRANAAAKAADLTGQMENELAKTPTPVDLTPAKQVVMSAVQKASNQNDLTTLKHLEPLFDQVSSLPDSAPARQALEYKRGLGTLSKFSNYAPVTDPAKAAARGTYHAVDSAIDDVAPKANDLNDRIHNLATISGARGQGHMGLGKYIIPAFLAHTVAAAGGGPLAEIASAGLAGAAETPTARLALGRAAGRYAPRAVKASYPFFLHYLIPQIAGTDQSQ